jgi:glycolate oxidase iron-sulfur subunit
MDYNLSPIIKEMLKKCMKCGNCQAVCPLYKVTLSEMAVARGKLSLVEAVLDGDLAISGGFKDGMDMCLLCGACAASCPNGVDVGEIILSARAAAVKQIGNPPAKEVIFSVLNKPELLDIGIKIGRPFQSIAFRKHPHKNAGYPRFPIGLDMRRIIPSLAKKTLRQELPETNSVKQHKMKVAFFTGCTINYIYTGIGKAVVNVLNRNSVEVIIPRRQYCCGTPIYTSGDVNTAREMARANIDIFYNLDVDAIITSCATCGEALKIAYPKLLVDDCIGYGEKALRLSEKVYDIAQFIVDETDFMNVSMGQVKRKVTYHDPCHLSRFLKVRQKPREIITSIPGIELAEMSHPDRCCGGAGSFSLTHYDTALAVNRYKVKDIIDTGTDTVLTGCPACRMQLEDGLNRYRLPHQVLHTIELLNLSYQSAYEDIL